MQERKKVLIIDDEVDLCQLLKSYFIKKNYEVFLSHDLKEGATMLKTHQPGLLFLDNNLPDGSGWQMAPAIALEYPNTFITLISGYYPQLPEMPNSARYGVIEKPVSFADLDRNMEKYADDQKSSLTG